MDVSYQSERQSERLSPWVVPSFLFHLLIISAFVLFEAEQEPSPLTRQAQEPITFVPVTIPQQSDDNEILFSLNLPHSSTFGATELEHEEIQLAQHALADPAHEVFEENEPTQHAEPSPVEQSVEQFTATEQVLADAQESSLAEQPQQVPHIQPAQPLEKSSQENHHAEESARRSSSSPIARKLSLARLAEGFLEYAKENGTEAVDINSRDINLEPTMQKIGWFLQNSFHLYNKALSAERDIRTQVTLHLELNADGSLVNCFLSPKSNIYAFDQNLLTIAKGAAPFPPLSRSVMRNRKTLAIKIPIEIDAKKGTHTYHFIFRS